MLINLEDSYSLECEVIEGEPSIKIVGNCYTVNYSSSDNQTFSYINHGSFRGFFINNSNKIAFKNYIREPLSDSEVLIVIPSNKGLLYILFDLVNGEVVYKVEN